ncbi:MAG: hypothetical protein LBF78_01550 [Treponema sp.]|jgi:hypothetical protein|nr:hypothetical protein [Treponema sp.]
MRLYQRDSAFLLRSLPPVLRARGFYLYTEGGKRLVDLWLDAGRNILGHKPPNAVKELKNSAQRGLFSPLPHPQEKRFIKALAKLFPRHAFRLYSDEASLLGALKDAGNAPDIPLVRPLESEGALFPVPDSPLFIPVIPCPLGPAVLVLDKTMEALFPPGDIIPPLLLALAARGVYDLIALAPQRVKVRYRQIEKALAGPDCKWRGPGIYLYYKNPHEEWKNLWERFLEAGFLLPPDPAEPLILPGIISPGEEKKLAGLLAPN